MLKKPSQHQHYNPTNPKKQIKPKTQLKAQLPESLGCFFIQLQQPKERKNSEMKLMRLFQ
jgi:hypothetical protein